MLHNIIEHIDYIDLSKCWLKISVTNLNIDGLKII